MDKIKLCWRWPGSSVAKTRWLERWADEFGDDFEIFCEASEVEELSNAGLSASCGGFDWGEASQAALLAFLGSGEARACVWIDDAPGPANLTAYAASLCKAREAPIALEQAGAALMLAGFQRLGADAP
jgi:hypothetical protein